MKKKILSFLTMICMAVALMSANITVFAATTLAGKTVTVPGNVAKIRLTSDGSVQKNGFTVTSVVPISDETKDGTPIDSETYGDNLTWTLYDSGTIKISGTGEMYDYSDLYYNDDGKLGLSLGDSINSVIIEDGVTSIGEWAFGYCHNLTNITISNSVTSIGEYAFYGCSKLTSVYITDLTAWCNIEFKDCSSNPLSISNGVNLYINGSLATDITIPDSVTSIGESAFYGCKNLKNVYYNGTEEEWNKISIDSYNSYLTNANRVYFVYFAYLILVDENGKELSKTKQPITSYIDISDIEKVGFTTRLYTDKACKNEFDFENTQITENLTLYVKYIPNQYTYKFLDENGSILKETTVDYGTTIVPPENPSKQNTKQYTYTFDKWIGYTEEMTVTDDVTFTAQYTDTVNKYTYKFLDENGTILKETTVDYGTTIVPPENPSKQNTKQYTYTFDKWVGYTEGMTVTDDVTFTAQYTDTVNKYTYKFLDNDNKVLKEETVNYGTVITPPEAPADKDPYTFDYWDGYTSGTELTDNVEFKAVYKYKTYKITAEGLENTVDVVYNDPYELETQEPEEEYLFDGYYTEKDGKGTKITDKDGKSLKAYDVAGNMTVYPYFKATYFNKTEIYGTDSPMPGDTITQKVVFATDKTARYFVVTVKYPEYLNFNSIKTVDFKRVSQKETTENKTKKMVITCEYGSSSIPINKNLVPIEITFDVATDAPIEKTEISLESAILKLNGSNLYTVTDLKGSEINIKPKQAESVEISVEDTVDKITKCEAVVLPDYTTDKTVIWSVDNEEIAAISQDGTLTPLKNGTVTVTATANDGSGKSGQKTVNIIAYAKPKSIKYNNNNIEIVPDVYEYTVYVKENDKKVTFNVDFEDGSVMINDEICIPCDDTEFSLNGNETAFEISYVDCIGYTDKAYIIKIVKFEGTKTTVSDDGKTFTVKPINIKKDNTVILALYNGNTFVGMEEPQIYNGEDLTFETNKSYTNAKIMVWNSLEGMKPQCEAENIE